MTRILSRLRIQRRKTTPPPREEIICEIQDFCADILESGGKWTVADGEHIGSLLNKSDDPWALFTYMDEQTGAYDVGYRTRDGREWFPIMRQMRNEVGSGMLERVGDYDYGARGRALR